MKDGSRHAPGLSDESEGVQPAWKIPVAYFLGLFVAGILAVAAFYKAGDPPLFFDQITAHQVTPESWSPFLAYFFIVVELLAAAAFVAFVWPRMVFEATIVLMLAFIAVTAWAWAQGNTEGCGCFGRLMERGPREVIVEDSVVILASLLSLWLLRNPKAHHSFGRWLIGGIPARRWQWAVAVPLMVLAVVITVFGAQLPWDGAIVGIKPGCDLSDMALQGARFPIDEGWVLLAMVGPQCPKCDEGIASLKQVVTRKIVPHVLAAYPGTPGEAQAWRMKRLPNFPVASAPERALRQYYRKLPATFLMEDGILRKVWWHRFPSPEEVAEALPAAEG